MGESNKKKRTPEEQRAYMRSYYLNNTHKWRTWGRQQDATMRDIVRAEKLRRGECANPDCRLQVTSDNHVAFDFDHRDRTTKLAPIGQMWGAKLVSEMAKCDLLCAVCHRLKTYRERDFVPLPSVGRSLSAMQLSLFPEEPS